MSYFHCLAQKEKLVILLLYVRFVSFGTRPKRISLIQIGFCIIAVADLRGRPRVQILSISCSFWENLANSYLGAPPREILDPPLYCHA